MPHALTSGSTVALSIIQGCLLVSVQPDLYDDLLTAIREKTLDKVYSGALKGVIFDMSAVKVLDSFIFHHLAETAKMIFFLGIRAVFAGFQPGVVCALVDMELDTTAICSFRTCAEALDQFAGTASTENGLDNYEIDAWGQEDAMEQYVPDK